MAKFPAKLGACIDMLYSMRALRQAKQREFDAEIDVLKSEETRLKDHIFTVFKKSEIEGAKGSEAQAAVIRADKYRASDFVQVWKWAVKHDAPQIFTKRLTDTAVRELYDTGTEIPGVEVFTVVDLSLTKVSKKGGK